MLRTLVFVLLGSAVHSQLKWRLLSATNKTDEYPEPRRDSSIGFDQKGNQLIIFGGRGSWNLDDTWSFDLKSKTWKKLPATLNSDGVSIPEKRFSMVFGAESGRDSFYIATGEFSGNDNSPCLFFNDILQFDFSTQTWTRLGRPERICRRNI